MKTTPITSPFQIRSTRDWRERPAFLVMRNEDGYIEHYYGGEKYLKDGGEILTCDQLNKEDLSHLVSGKVSTD